MGINYCASYDLRTTQLLATIAGSAIRCGIDALPVHLTALTLSITNEQFI
jgi:hypothetical protein